MKDKKKIILLLGIGLLIIILGGLTYFYFGKGQNNTAELEAYLKENYSKYVIDGSTSLIPLHEALEAKFGSSKEIKHSKTVVAFNDFVDGKIDILLAVDYLDSYFESAKAKNVEINKKEITKEALVFLRNIEFEQESLTLDQIKKIYNKEITYWKDIDKKHVDELNPNYPPGIQPIYRNEDSGSGMAMLKLLEKKSMDCTENECIFINDMGGVINALAYGLDSMYGDQLIAFNIYTFTEKQYHNENVKTFKINGIEPNDETIYNNEYPIILYNYIYYKNDKAKEFGEKLYEYLMTDAGQKLIMENGYVPLKKQNNVNDKSNKRNCQDNFVDEVCVKYEGYNEDFNKFVKISIDNKLETYTYYDTVEEYIFANSNINREEFNNLSGLLDQIIKINKATMKEYGPLDAIYTSQNISFKKQSNGDIAMAGGSCGGVGCIALVAKKTYDFGHSINDNDYTYDFYIAKDFKTVYSEGKDYQMEFSIPIQDFTDAFDIVYGGQLK